MRKIIKRLLHPFLKGAYDRRAKNPYEYTHRGISIIIYPGVFSPKGTISSELFVDYIEQLDLTAKKVLDLGAGSGLLGFAAVRKGAKVTLSDISEAAIAGLKENVSRLSLNCEVVTSDLFSDLPDAFDLVLINPPFYPRNPKNELEKAWFCGENFDYFERLFEEIRIRDFNSEEYRMILSQDCDFERISRIALKNYLRMEKITELEAWKEKNTIYSIFHQ